MDTCLPPDYCQTPISVSEGELHQRLCSESVLLIRREDILQRFTPDFSLPAFPDQRWEALDVEGKGCQSDAHCCSFSSQMSQLPPFLRPSLADACGRGSGSAQGDARHNPCELQLGHHALCPPTVRVGSGVARGPSAPPAVRVVMVPTNSIFHLFSGKKLNYWPLTPFFFLLQFFLEGMHQLIEINIIVCVYT